MIIKSIAATIFISCAFTCAAQTEVVRQKHFNLKNQIAIEGYDPVSYHAGGPREGKDEFRATHRGITYLFNTQANLDKFKTDPEKYEPAYGGWCAFAMGDSGEKVKVDPETFRIADGRLYLFYNFWGNNTLNDWNERERELKPKADRNWRSVFR